MRTVRNLLKALILSASILITACTNSKPQVDFLKSISENFLFPGAVLKINGNTTAIGNLATPNVEVSRLDKANKVEIFDSSSCDAANKLGEAAVTVADTSVVITTNALPADGVYQIYAKITYADNGQTECSANKVTYTLDTVAPLSPTMLNLITVAHNTPTPQIQVVGVENSSAVSLYSNSTCSGTEMGSAVATSTSATVTSVAVAEGTHTYFARVKDEAGNISTCSASSISYTYDITPPAVPASVALAAGTVTPNTSREPDVEVNGLVPGDIVKVYSDSLCMSEVASGNVTISTMNLTLSPGLSTDGSYRFYARAEDIYGNASACSTGSGVYTLDTTAPTKPTGITMVSPGQSPWNDPEPVFQVDGVSSGDTIRLYSDAACTFATVNDIATGSSILLTSNTLTVAGTYTFYADSTDAAGNISPCSTVSATYIFDNEAPTVTNVTSTNSDSYFYGPGSVIDITLTLSKNVTVNIGSSEPSIELDLSPARYAIYKSGSGTNTLKFEYVVQWNDSSTDLNYISQSALSLNGGSIKDNANNGLSNTGNLPPPNDSHSLGQNKSLVIKPQPPVLALVSESSVRRSESSGLLSIPVTLSYPVSYPITVTFNTYGNALLGVDYALQSANGQIGFSAGNTSSSFLLSLTNNALLNTTPRNIKISMSSATGTNPVIFARLTQIDVNIIDDETTAVASEKLAKGYGAQHSCVVKTDGSLYCWGANGSGQLGNSGTANEAQAVQILDATTPLKQVSVGANSTCAIKSSDDSLWCWGSNSSGQLGDTSNISNSSPLHIDSLYSYSQVSVGNSYACGIRKLTGAAYCWGENTNGKLGDGSTTNRNSPSAVASASTYSDISAGSNHTCAVTTGGTIHCWGTNNNSQLGDGTTTNSSIPVVLTDAGYTYSKVVAGNNHTCGLTTTGRVRCWGNNSNGQLGDGTVVAKTAPVQVISGNATNLVAGSNFTCAQMSTGLLQCWGNNSNGQFGNGSVDTSLVPTPSNATNVTDVSAGDSHVCVISNGDTKCFGNALYNQLGYGVSAYEASPAFIEGGYSMVSAGPTHTCGLTTPGGAVRCWGTSIYGGIGDGTSHPRTSPVEVIHSGATQVDVGFDFSCAVMATGQLLCWGNNGGGRLGDNMTSSYRTFPYEIMASGVQKVALGTSHACALKTDGSLYCWGDNTNGKVGNNSTVTQYVPIQILASGVTSFAVSETHSCAIKAGSLYCWGDNTYGQFGSAAPTISLTPTDTGMAYSSISVGKSYSCGITGGGTLQCFGLNGSSQLGDGTTNTSTAPVTIDAGTSYVKVDAYYSHTCGITTTGVLKCWGSNANYQLGVSAAGTTPNIVFSSASTVSVGYFGTCSVQTSKELYCWGANTSGQLGTGSMEFTRLPLFVLGL